jgi:hypothetical protein
MNKKTIIIVGPQGFKIDIPKQARYFQISTENGGRD